MILPTTHISALLLLIVSFVCLGSWINTFKLAGPRWRFELFYIDFAVGAVLFSVIAAFTLGSLGSDLAFTDRMLVAGRGAQVFVIAAGAVFNLGNMLLVAAVSLLGIAGAFPFSVGLALVITSFFQFGHGHPWMLLIPGILLIMAAVVLDGSACRLRERFSGTGTRHTTETKSSKDAVAAGPTPRATAAAKPGARVSSGAATMQSAHRAGAPSSKSRGRKSAKGLVIGTISGLALGFVKPIAARGMTGDFGLGPYAGLLMLSLGVLLATITLNFYFLNIAIDGEPLKFGAYFRGNLRQHLLGFGGGALWAIGTLTALLGNSVPGQSGVGRALFVFLPLASVLLAMAWGVLKWKEFASANGRAKVAFGWTAVLYLSGLVVLGVAFTR